MLKVIFSFILLSSLIFFSSCKDNRSQEQPIVNEQVKETAGYTLPGIPFDIRNKLRQEVTFVDYTFFNLPISVSQGLEDGVKQNIEFISLESPTLIPNDCKPVAHKYYSINGEIYMDIDMYFSNGCYFYIFLENNKPKYANLITEAGINFYNNILNQSAKMNQKTDQ